MKRLRGNNPAIAEVQILQHWEGRSWNKAATEARWRSVSVSADLHRKVLRAQYFTNVPLPTSGPELIYWHEASTRALVFQPANIRLQLVWSHTTCKAGAKRMEDQLCQSSWHHVFYLQCCQPSPTQMGQAQLHHALGRQWAIPPSLKLWARGRIRGVRAGAGRQAKDQMESSYLTVTRNTFTLCSTQTNKSFSGDFRSNSFNIVWDIYSFML